MAAGHAVVLTIGHSNHPLETFAALLRQHEVTALADVRSAPYSRFNPQFNRKALDAALKARGIAYVFLGHALGGRPDDASCYEDGRVRYDRLARTALYREGLDRVVRGASDERIALMCAEKEPLDCHRTILVGRSLAERGIAVAHILADGTLEPHGETMDRLLASMKLPGQDLFRSKEEQVEEALARRERRIAHGARKRGGTAPPGAAPMTVSSAPRRRGAGPARARSDSRVARKRKLDVGCRQICQAD